MTAFFVSLIFLILLSRFYVLATLNSTERKILLDHHNLKRKTSTPAPDPAKLVLLQWDDGLAILAQAWLDGCKRNPERPYEMGHVLGKETTIGPDGEPFGYIYLNDGLSQNNYFGLSKVKGSHLKRAIDKWDKQKENYDFCSATTHDFHGNMLTAYCGAYLALIFAKTTHVGCGKTTCGTGILMKDMITCYYWPSIFMPSYHCRPFKAKDDKFCGDDNPVDNSTERWCGSGGMVGKKTRKEVCEEKGLNWDPLVQCVVEENEKEENEKKVKEQEENEKEKGEEEKERRKRKGIHSGEDCRIGRAAWEVTTSGILTSVALGLGNILRN